jgi:hypothetical protein
VPAARVSRGRLVGLGGIVALLGVGFPDVGNGSVIPTAHRYNGSPSVGALFDSPHAAEHTSTASVIDSPGGDLLITAAHAIRGSGRGYVFVPAYDKGKEPYGAWTVTAAFSPAAWGGVDSDSADVAFLVVAPQRRHGRLVTLQSLTGGHALGSAPARGEKVTVPAYESGQDDQPFTCLATVYYDNAFPAFACHSYPGGTSGSPWLAAAPGGPVVVGVIGGLHQGGCQAVTSYTSSFGAQVRSAYAEAVRDKNPDVLPGPGNDGC